MQNLVVTDLMPPQETFNTVTSFPSGSSTSYNASVSQLTWNLPSPLPVGNYQLTYTAGVNNFTASGVSLVNNAQAVYTGQAVPLTASAVVVVTGNYTVKIGVYNEAGELIYALPVEHFSQSVDNYTLNPGNVINSLNGANNAVSIVYDGVIIGVWNGQNQSGAPVDNGNYYVKVDNINPLGVDQSTTQQVTVNRSIYQVSLVIYNEAGEAVRHLLTYMDDKGPAGLSSVQISSSVLSASANGSTGNNSKVTISLGGGASVAWDGTADNGAYVSSGQYFIDVHTIGGQGGETNVTLKVMVVDTNAQNGVGIVDARPNILNRASPNYTTTFVSNSSMNLTLRLKVYDTAGELVQKSKLGGDGQNSVQWDASGVASGLYLAVVESLNAQGGLVSKTTLKVVVFQ